MAADDDTMWALIEQRARATPEALLAVDEHDRRLTFGNYAAGVEGVAAHLASIGITPGDRVAWQLPTSLEALLLVGALARLGAVQIPILPIYRERELRFVLDQARPSWFLARSSFRGFEAPAAVERLIGELGLDCAVIAVDGAFPELPAGNLPAPPTDAHAVRWIFYTSGTTGEPKGALHTDASIAAGAAGVVDAYAVDEHDRYPIVFPFTHIGGVGMLYLQLLSGAGAIAVEQFDAEQTPPLLARHGLTIAAGGTPLAIVYLEQQRRHPEARLFPAIRATMTGAAPAPPGLHYDLERELGGIGALACYGLTEAPFLTVSAVGDPGEKRAATVGHPIAGATLRIVTLGGVVAAPGEEGEVRARGPQICGGYLDTRRNDDAFDDDGWFRTGDLGRLDEDGYLVITGRVKDIIIRKGENIAAKEVEDVLYGHPAVAEVAVVGLPDSELGERCCAVVVARQDVPAPTLAGIADFCRAAGLANQKIPERLALVAELPRNASGKVLKHALQAQLG
jgi:acyl-CoA synthetase (AMP-forming)/AMP-acid ligase II